MSRMGMSWAGMAVVAVIASLATLAAVGAFRGAGGPPLAFAQGEGVTANYVIALTGPEKDNRLPLFVIDTKAQTVLVYDYLFTQRKMVLRLARTYTFDRELSEYANDRDVFNGPSVKDVQEMLKRGR